MPFFASFYSALPFNLPPLLLRLILPNRKKRFFNLIKCQIDFYHVAYRVPCLAIPRFVLFAHSFVSEAEFVIKMRNCIFTQIETTEMKLVGKFPHIHFHLGAQQVNSQNVANKEFDGLTNRTEIRSFQVHKNCNYGTSNLDSWSIKVSCWTFTHWYINLD